MNKTIFFFIASFVLTMPQFAMGQINCPEGGVVYQSVCFPQGIASFADQVVSYAPEFTYKGNPATQAKNSAMALGVPDYGDFPDACNSADASTTPSNTCEFVSLGPGGVLILEFTDNVLTGSGDARLDLWIFEVGPAVEDSDIWVSEEKINNEYNWISAGRITGATSGIDLDAALLASENLVASDMLFKYVMIQDVAELNVDPNRFSGSDIDAVGAITTNILPVCSLSIESSEQVVSGPGTDPTPTPSGGVQSCAELQLNGEKITSLTFEYTGGGCIESDSDSDSDSGHGHHHHHHHHHNPDKACTMALDGSLDPMIEVRAVSGKRKPKHITSGYVVTPSSGLEIGDIFIVELPEGSTRFDNATKVEISNGVGNDVFSEENTETNNLHTSCSVPFTVGDVFGSLTLVGINQTITGGEPEPEPEPTEKVIYSFDITNNGDDVSNVTVVDSEFGAIGSPTATLASDGTLHFEHEDLNTNVIKTHIATVSAYLNGVLEACTSNFSTVDSDGDGIFDSLDNCPNLGNPNQADDDGDYTGNACEPDSDGDGVIDDLDNCVAIFNPDQNDSDGDLIGDLCDSGTPGPPKPSSCHYNANSGYDALLLLLLACGIFYGRNRYLLMSK